MIKKFLVNYEKRKSDLEEVFQKKHPNTYLEIVEEVVKIVSEKEGICNTPEPDSENIHVIDDGDYQGMQLFIIPEKGYQPTTYWATNTYYGSCSGCDTLQGIYEGYDNSPPTKEQVKDYMNLALHLLQKLILITN